MTLHDVEVALESIRRIADDDEAAHGLEDDLYTHVLEAIRDGVAEDPVMMAALALTSKDIHFARWCA